MPGDAWWGFYPKIHGHPGTARSHTKKTSYHGILYFIFDNTSHSTQHTRVRPSHFRSPMCLPTVTARLPAWPEKNDEERRDICPERLGACFAFQSLQHGTDVRCEAFATYAKQHRGCGIGMERTSTRVRRAWHGLSDC